MGKVLAKLMKRLSADGPKRILMLGLDNAGIDQRRSLILINIYFR